VLRKLLQAEP